jgi:hypothetical protein
MQAVDRLVLRLHAPAVWGSGRSPAVRRIAPTSHGRRVLALPDQPCAWA